MLIDILFWFALAGSIYAYLGFPVAIAIIARMKPRVLTQSSDYELPSISFLIPAHNEDKVIEAKLTNTDLLDYPGGKLEIIVISDGSSDNTDEIVKNFQTKNKLMFYRVETRKGKANALNTGLQHATGDIVVFSDSSILLEKLALREITANFADPGVGCISGQDVIPGGGGEGLYGRYELYLRNLESKSGSIVGASGSFYAQRRHLCSPFVEGLAPDFLSVLNTVEKGFRAISEPRAIGNMSEVSNPKAEFQRKVRTLLRGITTLWVKRTLLNPGRHGLFSFVLISHKLMRWLVPFFLVIILITSAYLSLSSNFYLTVFLLQILFYASALLSWMKCFGIQNRFFGKIPLYFTIVNLAIAKAWLLFAGGERQEIWEPSKRST